MGKEALVSSDEELMDALDEFQDAIDSEDPVRNADVSRDTLFESEISPPYEPTTSPTSRPERRRFSITISDNFALQTIYEELFANGEAVNVELGLW
jgi:hypothetical protein